MKRIVISLPDDLVSEINAYRRQADPLPNMAEAIRQLLRAGLEAMKDGKDEPR